MSERNPTDSASATSVQQQPHADSKPEEKAGLAPEEFQRQLVFVTATVLVFGIVGGTCLGMKIKRAQNARAAQASQTDQASDQMTPAERAKEETASSTK